MAAAGSDQENGAGEKGKTSKGGLPVSLYTKIVSYCKGV